MQILKKNGEPINIDLKTVLIWAAVTFGGYSTGANYPQLNPMQLLPVASECVK